MRTIRALSCLTVVGLLALGGCTPSEPDQEPTPQPIVTESAEPTATANKETSPAAAATNDTGDIVPVWANPVSRTGELIGTGEFDQFTVDVYQVGILSMAKDSMFVDPDTKESILPAGADVVFLNYVFTNTSGQTIPLSNLLVSHMASYVDWPYMGSTPGESSPAAYESLGLIERGYALGTNPPYEWAQGESYNVASSYKYEASNDLEIRLTLTPALPDGGLDHDNRTEYKFTVTIK